jgi:hypothetical protein
MEPKKRKPLSAYSIALGVIALAFLAGLTLGSLLSIKGGEAADGAIAGYLSPLTQNGVPRPDAVRVTLNTFFFPALCFALGFAIPGVALIPLAVLTRGFLIAYSASSFARVFGAVDGTIFSLSLFGIPLLLSLPCLLWIGTHGLMNSTALLGSAHRKIGVSLHMKTGLIRFGIALCALAVSAAVEIFLCPILAAIAVQRL